MTSLRHFLEAIDFALRELNQIQFSAPWNSRSER